MSIQISKWVLCDKYGWPLEKIRGRWIRNFLRCLIHGRRFRLWQGVGDFVKPKESTDAKRRVVEVVGGSKPEDQDHE